MRFEPRHYLLAGLGLIAALNLSILSGVWYNRSGEADSHLRLSERELPTASQGWRAQNSGLRLRLNWLKPQAEDPETGGHADLSSAQMLALGYPAQAACPSRCPRQTARAVLLVLELDGPVYQQQIDRQRQHLAQAQQAQARVPDDAALIRRVKHAENALHQLEHGSRLYLADVGLDRDTLRQRYPDRGRYAIVPGLVHPYANAANGLSGNVSSLIQTINLPHPWQAAIQRPAPGPARYQVELAFGQRLEPWITHLAATAP
jgi:hypothetical protein